MLGRVRASATANCGLYNARRTHVHLGVSRWPTRHDPQSQPPMHISTPPGQAQSVTTTMDPRSLLAPLHLLSFSALLGTQLYQTFIVTKICYVSLPPSAFTTLQKRLFPIYFRSQSLLLLLTVVTIPSQGPLTLIAHKAAWIPFAVAGVTATLNWWVYGPRTRQIMIERIHQGASASLLPYALHRHSRLRLREE